MMLKQSLWIIGFFFFGKLVYYEVIILKYKIYTQILIKRKFENVYMYRLNSMVVPNPYLIPNLCPLTVILSLLKLFTSYRTVGVPL